MSTLPATSGRRGNYCLPGTIKQGYLTKSPPLEKKSLMKHWKKRWCILVMTSSYNEPCLDYYRDEADTYSSLPIKRLSLAQCSKVEMDLQHSNHKHVFAIHLPGRVFYFAAPSDFEMREWADVLCTHLKLYDTSERDGNLRFPSPLRYPRGGSPPLKPRMAHSMDYQMRNVPHYATPPSLRRSITPPPRHHSAPEQHLFPPHPTWDATPVQDECPPPPPPPRSTTPTPPASHDKPPPPPHGTSIPALANDEFPPPPPPPRSTTPTPPTSHDKPPPPTHSTSAPTLGNDELSPVLSHTSSDEVSHSLPTSYNCLTSSPQEPPSTMCLPPPPPPRSTTPTPSINDEKVLPAPRISPPPPLPPRPEVLRHSGSSGIVYGTC